jgi:hypothetical protein
MRDPGQSGDQPSIGMAADVDTLVIGTSPSQSYAMLDAVMTEALGLAMYNAVAAQQNASTARNASVLMACTALLSLPVAAIPASGAQVSARSAAEPQAASAGKRAATAAAAASDRPATVQSAAASAQPNASAKPDADRKVIDPQVLDAINQIQRAVLQPEVVHASGAGKAYQLVAQSAAIAVQDATDALRGVSIIAATAAGVAMTRFLASGDPKYLLGLTAARDMMTTATDDFAKVAAAAANAVAEFPTS